MDTTGNYDATFYMSGFFYAVSGLILFLVYLPKCIEYVRPEQKPLNVSAKSVDV